MPFNMYWYMYTELVTSSLLNNYINPLQYTSCKLVTNSANQTTQVSQEVCQLD